MNVVNSKILSETIDLINNHVINYHFRNFEIKPHPDLIMAEIEKLNKSITINDFDAALNIMEHLNYISFEKYTDKTIKEVKPTNQGLLLFFNGGMQAQYYSNRAKRRLYLYGQISIVIGGIYYLIELIKSTSPYFLFWFNKL